MYFLYYGQCSHMCQTKVNVVTCEYIDFCPASVSQVFFCLVKSIICKSLCSHMWVHWPKCLKNVSSFSFLSERYLITFVVSYRLFVVFNNANAVSAEMWVWGFGNHAWYKSLVKSLVFDSWLDETFVSLVISKTPYSHFLLTAFTQCTVISFRFDTNHNFFI